MDNGRSAASNPAADDVINSSHIWGAAHKTGEEESEAITGLFLAGTEHHGRAANMALDTDPQAGMCADLHPETDTDIYSMASTDLHCAETALHWKTAQVEVFTDLRATKIVEMPAWELSTLELEADADLHFAERAPPEELQRKTRRRERGMGMMLVTLTVGAILVGIAMGYLLFKPPTEERGTRGTASSLPNSPPRDAERPAPLEAAAGHQPETEPIDGGDWIITEERGE